MRAVILTDAGALEPSERPEPVPGPGEVIVQVAYAGVQWRDLLVRDGHFPTPRPFVPGFEAGGTVRAVGPGVDPSRLGERVLALVTGGAFAELVAVPAALAVPVGDLDLRTAAGIGWTTPTAYDLVQTIGRISPGERVLIHAAAGGVGTAAVQFARAAGAERVVGVVGSDARAGYAKGFGYDEIVLRERFPADLGETFDVILDPVGGATRTANVELLAPFGRLVVYGNLASWEPVTVSANDLLMSGRSLLTYNSALLSQLHPERIGVAAAVAAVAAGELRVDVGAEYPLAELSAALDDLHAGRVLGKAVVRIG